MTKWTYEIIILPNNESNSALACKLAKSLNEQVQDGWELVSVTRAGSELTAFFKHEKK